MRQLTPDERETIIRFDDASGLCEIYTASPAVARRLKKAGLPIIDSDVHGNHYTCHKGAIVFKPKGGVSNRIGGRPNDLSHAVLEAE